MVVYTLQANDQKHSSFSQICGTNCFISFSKEIRNVLQHGLSQQGVWVPFWTPKPLKRTPKDTQLSLCGISKNLNLKLIIEFFHLLIIPMTLFNDIMPYFDKFIHVYGWNMSILWSPLKIWTNKNFTTANFRHPVSKSWLRHCPTVIDRFEIPPGTIEKVVSNLLNIFSAQHLNDCTWIKLPVTLG